MKEARVYNRSTSRRRSAAAALLLVLPILAFLAASPAVAALRNVEPGAAIPPFTLTDLAGAQKSNTDFAGQAKLVIFYSGNDRSKKVLEDAQVLYEKLKGDGFQVLAIYTGSDKNEAKTMAENAKAAFPVFLDSDKAAYAAWGVSVTPVMAFVGKDDKLLKEQPYVPLLAGILEIEAKVAMGTMSREDADLALKPAEAPQVSAEEKEADKLYNLGLVLLERGMKDKAMEKFKQVLQIDPAYCKVRLQMGQLYLDENKVDEAQGEFEYVLKCDPSSHEAKVGMGTVWGIKGDYDKAVEVLNGALQLNPRVELAYYELGKVYEKKGQLDKAVESFKKALERLLAK